MMSKIPVAGVVWQYLHYLIGLERLGFEVYYVETHAGTPSMLMREKRDDSSKLASEFLSRVLDRVGFGGRWAFNALHDDGRVYGMDARALSRVYQSAEVLINLHGGTKPTPELAATDRLVYLETDPVELQIELHNELPETIEFLEQHSAFFTFAETWGRPECRLPPSDRFEFRPTRQPVVIGLWDGTGAPTGPAFTTVGNWKQDWRTLTFEGETYTWSKHHNFLRYLDLPKMTGERFELALSRCDSDDRELLERHGWGFRDASELSADPDVYRSYIAGSRAEFTVAKDQNVRLRTGWFSDRSATYLAAGRPVVTEETGFSSVIPTGHGLFAFESPEEAAHAIAVISGDYQHHRHAASQIAREWFDHRVVLKALLSDLGIRIPHHRPRRGRLAPPYPRGMVIQPESRRPLRLPRQTARTVMRRPIPSRIGGSARRDPSASVVVVIHNNLVLTRMCLESVLENTAETRCELIVVDNGSRDGTARYLARLASSHARVRAILNGANMGFAPACNQGLALARGTHLVLLNNDVMVPPGWLPRLLSHLDDAGVGLVGPTTNRIGNEAQVDSDYRTWGEYLRFAARRAKEHSGQGFELRVPTMFCLAMRRDVFSHLGPLDERYELGLLEDDDYAERARRAGYTLRCAEDVFVHHFGEGSFGKLVPSGEYQRVLAANRRRFQQKWGIAWQPYERRQSPRYLELRTQIRRIVDRQIPSGARILVVSRGDDELTEFDGHIGMHFPQDPSGVFAGDYPRDDAQAIAQLEELRAKGAAYLVIPRTGAWWLDHYRELRRHLETRYRLLVTDGDAAVIYDLGGAGENGG